MSNYVVNTIPEQRWFSEKSKKIVENFSSYAKEHKEARLVLAMFSEHESLEDLDFALEEGMYDFIFPESNPYSKDLEIMVEEAAKYPRFLGFDVTCLDI